MNKALLWITVFTMMLSCRRQHEFSAMHIPAKLNGTWVLNYISGPRIAFEGLYPGRIPEMTLDIKALKVNGNTGCNNFNGAFTVNKDKIDLQGPFAMTRMMCEGQGENLFVETLKKVTVYEVDDNTLTLLMDDLAVMRFVKKIKSLNE